VLWRRRASAHEIQAHWFALGLERPGSDQIRLSWYEHKLDDEYLTVREVAEHLKLNQQTVRNWIDAGTLPAVRIGRRVRVRRVDLERVLAQDTSGSVRPEPSPVASDTLVEAREQLAQALAPARRLLGRRSAVRRTELADGLQELTDAVAAALTLLSNNGASGAYSLPGPGDSLPQRDMWPSGSWPRNSRRPSG